MKDLPLVALRALAAVHAHQGVRAAARELGIAHSSVSRHLAELEAWLGVALTERSNGPREFALTRQGTDIGEAALSALRDLEQAVAAVREAKPARAVTVSTTPSFAARWLLPHLGGREGPLRTLQVSVVVDQQINDLRAEGIDLAIRMGRGPWPGLDCEPLMDDALYPVMSTSLFERSGRPSTPAQLRGLPLLHDRDPNASWAAWRALHGPPGLDVKTGARLASSDLVLRAAALSQGVALAHHRLVADDIASGALVRPIGCLSVPLPDAYWLVMTSRSRGRAEVVALAAWLKKLALASGPAR